MVALAVVVAEDLGLEIVEVLEMQNLVTHGMRVFMSAKHGSTRQSRADRHVFFIQ